MAECAKFAKFVYTPVKSEDLTLAIAACRAGGFGIFNADLEYDDAVIRRAVQVLAAPLLSKGVKIGILIGSGYLYTRERTVISNRVLLGRV